MGLLGRGGTEDREEDGGGRREGGRTRGERGWEDALADRRIPIISAPKCRRCGGCLQPQREREGVAEKKKSWKDSCKEGQQAPRFPSRSLRRGPGRAAGTFLIVAGTCLCSAETFLFWAGTFLLFFKRGHRHVSGSSFSSALPAPSAWRSTLLSEIARRRVLPREL